MSRMLAVLIAICYVQIAVIAKSQDNDVNAQDTLKLYITKADGNEYRIAVDIHNDQELAGLDIPLRFGLPADQVSLVRVEWSDRVLNWDFKHAAIDNTNKTVILGLIAELGGTHPDPYLLPLTVGDPTIAILVFKVEGDHQPELSTFTTDEPHHSLTFLYNRLEDSVLTVKEFSPVFRVSDTEE